MHKRLLLLLAVTVSLGSIGLADLPVRPVPQIASRRSLEDILTGGQVGIYRIKLAGALFAGDETSNAKDLEMVLVRTGKTWEAQVAGRASEFNQGAHKGTVRDTSSPAEAVDVVMSIGSDRWVPGDDEAPYSLKLKAVGSEVTGTYSGEFRDKKVTGQISGDLEGPGWYGCQAAGDARAFSFDMGTERKNWNNARWGGYNFLTEVDVSRFDGVLLTVATDKPRQDAWVDLGVMEKDGSCYTVRDAIPLDQKSRQVYVAFEDLRHAEFLFNGAGTWAGVEGNFDEDFHFDPTSLYRMMIGVVNPLGVGEVNFRISDIQFVALSKKPIDAVPAVQVTGELLQVNEQKTVPGGIFGFHEAGGSWNQVDGLRTGSVRPLRAMGMGGSFVASPRPELGIDLVVATNYDRKQQLPQIEGSSWKDKMVSTGQGLGNQAKGKSGVAVEFWNEPYLDLGRMLESQLAGKVKPPADAKPGDPVVFNGKEMESMVWVTDGQKLVPRDPSRFTYWSARQIGTWYTDAYLVVAGEAKKIAPDLQMIGGFGFRWSEDEWAAWRLLYKDLIDRSIDVLDGVCEHHYQGYTDGMAASYEVLTAYSMAEHGKWLKAWNTETNDLWDAPARGNAYATNQFGGKFRSRRRLVYNLRDILYCIDQTPDKIEARAIHALWRGARDERRKIGQSFQAGRGLDAAVTSLTFAGSYTYSDNGKETTIQAPEGKTFAVVTFQLKNTDRRNRALPVKDIRLVRGEQKVDPAAYDNTGRERYQVEKGKTSQATIAFAVDPAVKSDVLEVHVGRKKPELVHVNGPFEPRKFSPWAQAGIDKGEWIALDFMKDLRGRMVRTISAHENLWTVASVDAKTRSLVVIVYNDGPRRTNVQVNIDAPEGTTFTSQQVAQLVHDSSGAIAVEGPRTSEPTSAGKTTVDTSVAAASATRITLGLSRLPTADAKTVVRKQIFAGRPAGGESPILHDLMGGQSIELPFKLPADAKQAVRASVRVVVERVGKGEGWFSLNGKRYEIPKAHTPPNAPYIREVSVDPSELAGVESITFSAGGNGYRLCAASVVLETEK
ncbi:MAG: hypothetical protein ACOCZE_04735 [Planctomycetota bacterium]